MAETIQVGRGGRKSKAPRWQFVVALAVTVVLAAGAGAFVRWLQTKHESAAVINDTPLPPDSVAAVQDLLANGNTAEADRAVKEQLQNTSLPAEERYELYMTQGQVAYVKEDYKEAEQAYTNAYSLNPTFEVARRLGSTWQQLGNNQKAIEYYQKAIELNPPDNPTREADNNVLQQMINALGAGGA